ncbi:MAG TPA: phosphoribosylformylglycinamidine cyclo-ligase [Acidimicrobiia bacterium]
MTRPDRRPGEPLTYAEAGVDIAAGDKAVELIKHHVRSTFRSEVIGDVGGFAGLFSLGRLACEDPVLVASTDGVGTKSLVTRLTGRYDTIGLDVVAMSVDDVAANGAEPLFFLDYLSVGKLVPGTVDEIVAGVADGCRQANCALLGGEMSEHPDAMEPGEFDLVGFAVGVVGRDRLLPAGVRAGDRVLGIASPGLRCNGYSLARRALLDVAGRPLDGPAWDGAEHTLGDELARPSEIYAPALARLRAAVPVHALVHVTGGGIPGNLTRVLPENCDAVVRRGSWPEPRIFAEVQRAGAVPGEEMAHVFNLGLGMLAVVAPDAAASALETLAAAGREAWEVGTITPGDGRVTVQG